jgi:hypothetical protein
VSGSTSAGRVPPVLQEDSVASAEDAPWLDGVVDLPAGYKTTRRDILKLLPLAGMLASFRVVLTRAKVSAPVGTLPLKCVLSVCMHEWRPPGSPRPVG